MKTIPNYRIDNLEFRPSTYLLPKEQYPDPIGYSIDHYSPNTYYGREEEFPLDPRDPNFRVYPDYPNCRVHKDCFKHPQSCCTIAHFEYNSHEGYYELEFIGDRPLELTPKEWEDFRKLLEYGFKHLSSSSSDEDSED